MSRIVRFATLGWLLCLTAPTPPAAAQDGQVVALREGNRLFREGRPAEAFDAYLSGYDAADPNPVLCYNLGATVHRLDRLPEAILWYRRAEAANPGDPWLRENLEAARATLGLQPYPAPGLLGAVARQATLIQYVAALLAWIGAALWMARARGPLAPTVVLLGAAVALWGGAAGARQWAPEAAVVLRDCSAVEGDLPAGSEVWTTGEPSAETVRVAAGRLRADCPADSVTPVRSVR